MLVPIQTAELMAYGKDAAALTPPAQFTDDLPKAKEGIAELRDLADTVTQAQDLDKDRLVQREGDKERGQGPHQDPPEQELKGKKVLARNPVCARVRGRHGHRRGNSTGTSNQKADAAGKQPSIKDYFGAS